MGISSGTSTGWLFVHCVPIELEFRKTKFNLDYSDIPVLVGLQWYTSLAVHDIVSRNITNSDTRVLLLVVSHLMLGLITQTSSERFSSAYRL